MIERLAAISVRYRYRAIAVWLAALIGVVVLGGMVTSTADINDRLDGSDSQRAYDLAAAHMPSVTGISTTVVFKTTDLQLTAAVVDEIAALPRIDHVDGPLDHPEQVGPGGISFAAVSFSRHGPPTIEATAAAIEQIAAAHQTADLQVALGGEPFVNGEVPATEGIGLAAAVVILLIAFGSVVAMGLPIVSALIGIGLSLSAIPLVSSVLPTADFTSTVAAMIGLGVGIDYALFMVTRYRAELASGRDVGDAIAAAVRTSGRAIVFAGGTVVVSLLGLLLIGMDFLKGFAVASSLTVAIAVAAAVTLVPALLAILGRRIDRLSIHRRGHVTTSRDNLGRRWGRVIQHHPVTAVVAGGAVLLLAALPVLSMRLAVADEGNDPVGSTTRVAYDRLAEGFGPGVNGPLLVVVEDATRVAPIVEAVRATDGVAFVATPQSSPDGAIGVFAAYPTTSPQSPATEQLVRDLRNRLPSGVHLGGQTASGIDFSAFMAQRLPWFIGAVLLVSFLLLLAVFRSLLVPLEGGDPEPRVDRSRLRRDGRCLPVGLVLVGTAHRTGADRTLGADDAVRHRVRSVDGLRGVPAVGGEGALRRDPRQPRSRARRIVDHGASDHRGSCDHGVRVRQLHGRRPAFDQADRLRAGCGGVHRCHDRAPGDGAGNDGAARAVELVATASSATGTARRQRWARLR